jgi:hypothetical protein
MGTKRHFDCRTAGNFRPWQETDGELTLLSCPKLRPDRMLAAADSMIRQVVKIHIVPRS